MQVHSEHITENTGESEQFPITGVEKPGPIYMVAVALLLGVAFAASFLIPNAVAPATFSYVLVNLITLVLTVVFLGICAYMSRVSLRMLTWVFVPVFALQAYVTASHLVLPDPFAPILGGISSGLALSISIGLVVVISRRWIRVVVVGGHFLGVFLALFAYSLGRVAVLDATAGMFIVLALGASIITCFTPWGKTEPIPAKEILVSKGGTRGFVLNLMSSQPSVFLLLLLTTFFMFVMGVFFGYTRALSYSYSDLTAMIAVTFLVFAVLLALTFVMESRLWFTIVFTAVLVTCAIALLAVLVSPAHITDVLGLISMLLAVAMAGIVSFTAEVTHNNNIPGLFGAATTPIAALVLYEMGCAVSYALHTTLPPEIYNISFTASLTLGSLSIGSLLLLSLVLWKVSRNTQKGKAAAPEQAAAVLPVPETAEHVATDSLETIEAEASLADTDIESTLMDEFMLTPREAEVVLLFAGGRSARFIADTLYVAESTVKTHLKRAYVKLDVHDRQSLISLVESYSY